MAIQKHIENEIQNAASKLGNRKNQLAEIEKDAINLLKMHAQGAQ